MDNSVFISNTYGIGQLITQKKKLEVPLYQRDYSWGSSEVEQFLEDIFTAIDEKYPNYFLGSLVLTQPSEGVWGILDGQQRITTVSIIYSTIRFLLYSNSKVDDAEQITSEFLGVRKLGGQYAPRVLLNEDNRDFYNLSVVKYCSEEDLIRLEKNLLRSRSNSLLLNAIKISRKRIREWIIQEGEESVLRLYQLSSYIENKALVVSIEVADESDAFMAFETLNTRGQDLSALDLVKNYIFGTTQKSKHDTISFFWSQMRANIGEKQADDFLRIFWMGNYGLIQKSRLYPSLKRRFSTADAASRLAENLSSASYLYAAIEEPKHELWKNYSPYVRHLIEVLNLLKSKQIRPIIFSCINLKDSSPADIEAVLWNLLVLTIRFQTIGKRRQGILEKNCARIAEEISSVQSINLTYLKSEIRKIITDDEEFLDDFKKYQETNLKRALYFLASIEIFQKLNATLYKQIWESVEDFLDSRSDITISHIVPKKPSNSSRTTFGIEDEDEISITSNLSNLMLVNENFNLSAREVSFNELKHELSKSEFWTTTKVADVDNWNFDSFSNRQHLLSEVAVKIWTISE
jgi:hypothetical protein